MIKAAIFDMDGLMYDTERVALEAWLFAAKEMGFSLTKEQCDSFRGTNKAYKEKLFADWYQGAVDYEEAFAMRGQYIDHYLTTNGVPVKKGLLQLMEALKQRQYRIAVATGTGREKAEQYWKETGVFPYLDASVCGNEVTNSKPDPEIFLKAAKRLNVPVSQCMILEDSYNGIEAAKQAGGIVVMIPDTLAPTEEIRKKCNYIFDDLEEVISIL